MPDFNKSTYDQEYIKQNIMRIPVNINRKTDPDLVGWLSTIENRQGYIRSLIRADMEKKLSMHTADLPNADN